MLDKGPTERGESAQGEASHLVEIIGCVFFEARRQGGITAGRGQVQPRRGRRDGSSRMVAEHGMVRSKEGKDDGCESGNEELGEDEEDVVAPEEACSRNNGSAQLVPADAGDEGQKLEPTDPRMTPVWSPPCDFVASAPSHSCRLSSSSPATTIRGVVLERRS